VRHFFPHTNGIEGACTLLQRQIYRIHYKHLTLYLAERTCRYNYREVREGARYNAAIEGADRCLRYKGLIA
jgi:hypothetical protein